MSYTVAEKPASRGSVGVRPDYEQAYIAYGSGDTAQLEADLVAQVPATRNNRPRERIDWLELVSSGPVLCYEAVAYYAVPDAVVFEVGGTSAYAFSIQTTTQHITQSKATVARYAGPGTFLADHGGAIGVDQDGEVQGCDIVVPTLNFDETHLFEDAAVTNAFKGTIFNLCAKTNDNSFKGLARGECLFLGASGGRRQDGKWEITFNNAGSRNVTNLEIGAGTPYGPITVTSKKGWEYLWVEYVQTEVSDGGAPTPKKRLASVPLQANVERVYDEGNLALLGIGT